MDLTQGRLKSMLSYNRETGVFAWLPREEKTGRDKRFNREKAGTVAGCLDNKGYVIIKVKGRCFKAHRLAWLYEFGTFPDGILDHKNRTKDDNRIDNLRLATTPENGWNQTKASNNTSGAKGVYFEARVNKWRARITYMGRLRHIGTFDRLEDARAAYRVAANELFGEYATDGEAA